MSGRIVVLSGGVGGAKLALGLAHAVDPKDLMIVTNTGDDFDHYGLRVCPDTDTVLYTLGDVADRERGWGRADESWRFMETFRALGGADWFNLGDRDLALHVLRTARLRGGETLSAITADIARTLGIAAAVIPMSDQPVSTHVETTGGPIPFQHYFVREQCAPVATGFAFEGIAEAAPNPALLEALEAGPRAVLLAPSNPFVSIDPILALPGLRDRLRACGAPVVAVSPIIGGRSIKGPAAKMMAELRMPVSPAGIARHYRGLIDGLVIDEADRALAEEVRAIEPEVTVAQSVMRSLDDRIALARCMIDFADGLSAKGSP